MELAHIHQFTTKVSGASAGMDYNIYESLLIPEQNLSPPQRRRFFLLPVSLQGKAINTGNSIWQQLCRCAT